MEINLMKRIMLVSLLLILAAIVYAKPVSTNQAIQVAENWMLERTGQTFLDSSVAPLKADNPDNFIWVVSLRPTGYVLIASDDAATPIIGYNAAHGWGEYPIPPQLQYMLNTWQSEMQYIVNNRIAATLPISLLWQRYNVSQSSFVPNGNFRDVSPLLTTTWGQEGYYNDLCPSGTPVGCVATAMSQIMKYWSFPTTGNGSHTYVHPTYGTQTANFGTTTYNWAGMPNQVNNANTSVATLSYHAGVAVEMDYHPTGSGAYSTDVEYAMENYFRYSPLAAYHEKSEYNDTAWATLLRGEFDNARPVYYSGYSVADGGHAWVVDGYQGTNYFHFNWGWDGAYNGYYYLTNLNPGGYNFSSGQAAVIGITPTQSSANLSEGFEGTTFPPAGWSVTASTFTRSATLFITGAFSARYVTANISGAAGSGKQLRTPLLTVNATSAPITFKAKRNTTDRGEKIRVGYSTSATGPYAYLSTFTLTATAATYTQAVTAITPGDYYFVLETLSTVTNVKTWIIDDVTGPGVATPFASLNITSWAAGNVNPGESASSGATFQLSNTGGGILAITSVTNLSATEYKSTINPAVQLVYGQVHEFGFTYDPLNYGTDNTSFQIVTNGGTLTISLTGQALAYLFSDGFENYADFTQTITPWTQYDGDLRPSYTIEGMTFPNQGYTGSFMVFNPSQVTPDMSGSTMATYSGSKGAYCFDAVPTTTVTANNDWLISPLVNLVGPTCSVSFWAKSYTDQYGLERFKVRYSTTNNTYTSFTSYLAGTASTYISAPITWTLYNYTLPITAKYVAIQCVSADAFIFMVDNFTISDSGQTPPVPTFGNVSGYVYEFGTTTPIANAVVTVGSKSATSNSSGYYIINNLVVGTYGGNCTAPGRDFFNSSVTGIAITQGNTFTQNFFLKWSELEVNANSFTANLYLGQTNNQTLVVSNPGGTADLTYYTYLSPAAGAIRMNEMPKRAAAVDESHRIPSLPAQKTRTAVSGSVLYGDIADAEFYTSYAVQRATKFTMSDFGLWSDSGVTITQLETYFYEPSTLLWGAEDTFMFRIYAANGTTVLHTSGAITAVKQTTSFNPTTYILPTPLTIDGDFWVAVIPEGATTGSPYGLSAGYSYGCSYYGTPGAWTVLDSEEHIISAQVNGNLWVSTSGETGTVAPAGSENITISFDTADLSVGSYQGYLTVINNSNYIAPNEANPRGDNLVIPLTLNVLTGSFGNMNGHVYYFGTTTPVAGATVTLPNYAPVTTDANGYYSFTNINTETTTVAVSANGCQNYSGTMVILNGQTTVKDMYLDYSQFSASQTVFNLSCDTGSATSASTTLSNLGSWAVDWTTDSGIWGGDTYLSDPLNATWEDNSLANWTGSIGPNSDLYGSPTLPYGYNSNVTWVFNSNGTTAAQYIITPQLHCTASDNLSFWYKQFNDSSETIQILVSRTDNAIGSFALFATIGPLTGTDWVQFNQSLSDYAGEDIYICFNYPRTDGYEFGYVMIDNISGPQVNMPYAEWLSSSVSGTLNAGAGTPFTLNVNAATLPVGNYTAQTWVFGTATNSPYKLFVNLSVNQPLALDAPLNPVTEAYPGFVAVAWDEVDNANGYHVYACDQPNGTYQEVLFTADSYVEIPWANITALGFPSGLDRVFFRITADSAAPRNSQIAMKTINSAQTLDKMIVPNQTRTLHTSK